MNSKVFMAGSMQDMLASGAIGGGEKSSTSGDIFIGEMFSSTDWQAALKAAGALQSDYLESSGSAFEKYNSQFRDLGGRGGGRGDWA